MKTLLTDKEMRDLEKLFHAERVRTSDEEYLIIYPGEYGDWQRAIESAILAKLNSAEPVAYSWIDSKSDDVMVIGAYHYDATEAEKLGIKAYPLFKHPPAPSAEEVFNQSESDQTLHACISFVIHGDADFDGMDVGLVDYFKKAVIAARSEE